MCRAGCEPASVDGADHLVKLPSVGSNQAALPHAPEPTGAVPFHKASHLSEEGAGLVQHGNGGQTVLKAFCENLFSLTLLRSPQTVAGRCLGASFYTHLVSFRQFL